MKKRLVFDILFVAIAIKFKGFYNNALGGV